MGAVTYRVSSDQRPDGLVALGGATVPAPPTSPGPQPADTSDHDEAGAVPRLPSGHGSRPAAWAEAGALSEERLLAPRREAPRSGWRRLMQRASFGLVNPGPGPEERRERELAARVQAPIPAGSVRVAVLSRKGGVGKTTTTLMLGHSFASWRGDRIVALDGNPDAGSLGYRVRRETSSTVSDLLAEELLERYADIRAHTSQAPSRLEVVDSDDDPRVTEALGEMEYRKVILQLERHYNLILLDTGTGILDSATQGILRVSDQLVLVLAPSLDGARAASLTLDWLVEHSMERLVAGSVAVINQARDQSLVEVGRVEEHFAARCRATQRIPWDRHLDTGAVVAPEEVRAETREAYLELAAAIARSFTEPAARRS